MPLTCPVLPLSRRARATALAILTASPLTAWATNGMLLESYGPIAAGMGGASMALDNGLAAATNNPATLGLMAPGKRLDLALGQLGPRVSSQAGPMQADSGGTRYVMPAFGYGRSDGRLSYGLAVFAQGGMGTEYGANSFLAMGSGAPVRSELGVGRVIVPVAWKLDERLIVGGSVDLVWSTLDLRMAATGAGLGALVTSAGGNLAAALPGLAGAPWARLDFSDGSDFSGEAKSYGYAAKLGAVLQATPDLRLGAALHLKTRLQDMRSDRRASSLSAPGFADRGRITVQDFQMPSQFALGLAWQASADWLLAADVKHIAWSDVMGRFRMRYDSQGMGGTVSFALPQQWRDQTVLQLGAARRVGPWTLRAGANLSRNPVPDRLVNPLFPAIVAQHYTLGTGYRFSASDEINAAMSHAPKVSVNTPDGVIVSHRQLNLQLMYSHAF